MNARNARYGAVAAAVASALLYFLIGFEVLDVGESRSGGRDILSFGLTAGSTFAVIAVLLALAARRWILAVVAVLDVAVIVGYFALAAVREPEYEPWGLLVKVSQLVLLAAIGYLLIHRSESARSRSLMQT